MRSFFARLFVASTIVVSLSGCARAPRSPAPRSDTNLPGFVLYEMHTQTAQANAETLVTYVTAGAVRVSHAAGDAILDFDAQRIVLLDAGSHTYRQASLATWEARIAEALEALRDSSSTASPSFERAGSPVEVAGYTCERFVLFTTRNLLGTQETVEQQVWVTTELELPVGAFEAYQRALGMLDNLGLPAAATYPEGVILRREVRTRPAKAGRRVDSHVEASTVFRVEQRRLSTAEFAIPPGYEKAPSSPK